MVKHQPDLKKKLPPLTNITTKQCLHDCPFYADNISVGKQEVPTRFTCTAISVKRTTPFNIISNMKVPLPEYMRVELYYMGQNTKKKKKMIYKTKTE